MLSTKRLAFVALCLALTVPAFARDWHIARFDTQMTVAQDGVATVTERLDVVFEGVFHGIYRDIPIEYPGEHGNYTLFLSVTGVTDGEGNKLKYESSTQNGSRHLKIYVPDAVDATRTVEIHYTVTNAVRWFDDYDELYWNVTGNDWPVPIESASASIVFPPNAAGQLKAQAFTGVYGSKGQRAGVKVSGNTVSVETTDPLSRREGLTADVYIPKGVLTQPSQLTQAIWFLRSNIIVLLPLWAFIVMFFFWWTKGRDPKPDISVAPMYEPPKGMTPAEVGTLVDDKVHPRDITATLVDLAVKGYVKIEEKESKTLLFSHRDYIFHLLKPPSEWAVLESHERVMLNHMFAAGGTDPFPALDRALKGVMQQLQSSSPPQQKQTLSQVAQMVKDQITEEPLTPDQVIKDDQGNTQVQLSDLKNQFYVAIPTMKNNILAELKGKGMYSVDPESAHAYVVGGVLLTALPFVFLMLWGGAAAFQSPGLIVGSGIVAVLIIFLFARIMTAKSRKGVDTKVEILGLQEFITRVDADRLKRMPPDTFEKILPYAMALGIENRWAKAFEGVVQNPPNWYVGPTPYVGFNPIFFAGSMHAMATDAHQAFVAAPRASSTGSGWSSGGGFGGGGFSGGGFGGGGGGAF